MSRPVLRWPRAARASCLAARVLAGLVGLLLVGVAPVRAEPECTPRAAAGVGDARPLQPGDPLEGAAAKVLWTGRYDCLLMTADGRAAAFTTQDGVTWFGTREAPAIDVLCLRGQGCDATQAEVAWRDAVALGLVACAAAPSWVDSSELIPGAHAADVAPTRGTLAVVGATRIVPLRRDKRSLRVRAASGWRSLRELAKSDAPRAPHEEELGPIYQHPAGGPLFLPIWSFIYNGESPPVDVRFRVEVVEVDEATWCPPTSAPAAPKAAPVAGGDLVVRALRSSPVQPPVGGYTFEAKNLLDGDLTTSWQPRDPRGWFEVDLGESRRISAIELVNGFAHRDATYGDLFVANARARTVTLTFSDGSAETITLATDTRDWQTITFTPRETSSLRLTVRSVAPGARWPRDVAISELRLR